MGDSLRDSFASRGFSLVENCLRIEEEHPQRLKKKVLEIVETHPTIAAIRNREAVTVATGGVIAYTKARVGWAKPAVVRVEYSQGV